MSPYEAVYGRSPPTLLDYVGTDTTVDAVHSLLSDRSHALATLKENLRRAQNRMKSQADAKRTDASFKVGDWVFLKLQPNRQRSLTQQPSHKLSKRFFGPFQILEKIGTVAYRLELPEMAQLHDVFHISKLKLCRGDPSIQQLPLPTEFKENQPIFKPLAVLRSRLVLIRGQPVRQHVVQWEHHSVVEATWVAA